MSTSNMMNWVTDGNICSIFFFKKKSFAFRMTTSNMMILNFFLVNYLYFFRYA